MQLTQKYNISNEKVKEILKKNPKKWLNNQMIERWHEHAEGIH